MKDAAHKALVVGMARATIQRQAWSHAKANHGWLLVTAARARKGPNMPMASDSFAAAAAAALSDDSQ